MYYRTAVIILSYILFIVSEILLLQKFRVKDDTEESEVVGVTWLENKIYVVCKGSNRVHVFPDQEPFDELEEEEIKIKGMKQPRDMSASKDSRSIFISDQKETCLWRVQMSDGEICRWKLEGTPSTLSITLSDELIVVVHREGRWYLDMFSCVDGNRSQSIPLSTEINQVLHAVQSSDGNTFISLSTAEFPDVFQIQELSIDKRNARSFGNMKWKPVHISVDKDGGLLGVDGRQVHLLNSSFTGSEILMKSYQHNLTGPERLCYIREKHLLIVGQKGFPTESGFVSVFSME